MDSSTALTSLSADAPVAAVAAHLQHPFQLWHPVLLLKLVSLLLVPLAHLLKLLLLLSAHVSSLATAPANTT